MTIYSPTQEQVAVINHPNGVYVEACPGAGKTRTLVHRCARLAETIPPRHGIALISFTNATVEEYRRRCSELGFSSLLQYPNLISTFDSFLTQFFIYPVGVRGIDTKPTVIESWSALGIEIRLREPHHFKGSGVSLDLFDPITNDIDPANIGHRALRQHVTDNLARYKSAAKTRRASLRKLGYLSAADARAEVTRLLKNSSLSSHLGNAIASRFYEIVVDEAQDCNTTDLKILHWLRKYGIRISLISDPDQAIYEFRDAKPRLLRAFGSLDNIQDRLTLTGNFRCTQVICNLAATLRPHPAPDNAVGEYSDLSIPIHILNYSGRQVPNLVSRFRSVAKLNNIDHQQLIVLAHSRAIARRAAGGTPEEAATPSNVTQLAWAVSHIMSPNSPGSMRTRAIMYIEKMLLKLMGVVQKHNEYENPERLSEQNNVDRRWLRRTALELASRLAISVTSLDCENWVKKIHEELKELIPSAMLQKNPRTFFRIPPTSTWFNLLLRHDEETLPWSTVHEAKGKEYDGVLLVIPPDKGPEYHTSRLFKVWETRQDDEAKRVLYVGVTRAKRLVALAVPTDFFNIMQAILRQNNVPYELSE